ncbi:MAG: MFS transporter [Balneolaceae bacterium]|nr:MFS transporter [Balneolaceae bacterium]
MTQSEDILSGIQRNRIFTGICLALLPTAFTFVLVSNILQQLKTEFLLTNAQVGYIGGATLWGMALSLLLIGPTLEKIGFKTSVRGAFVAHLSGVTLFLAAYGFAGASYAFWILFLGAVGFGLGNGLIEVVGNNLTAALFPDNMTTKLNHFHAFFPGGMVFGGVLGWAMVQVGTLGGISIGHWSVQIAIVYIPVLIYGYLLLPVKFPPTLVSEAGIPIKEMFKYTFTHPLVWGLIILKMITLSLELGPGRWIPEVLQAAGVHGILVFAWISGIMMLLRFFAGPFVEKLSPPGMLFAGSLLTGIGLLLFAFFESGLLILMIAATVYAAGIAFHFPTMVGLMSERFPRAGSLGIVLLMGMGFFGAGASNAIMGGIADQYLPDALDEQKTVQILQEIDQRFPEYIAIAEQAEGDPQQIQELGYTRTDLQNILSQAEQALAYYEQNGEFDSDHTPEALRALLDAAISQESELTDRAFAVLRPADNYGGRMSILYISPAAFLLALIFLGVYINDKRKGGYKVEKLHKDQ